MAYAPVAGDYVNKVGIPLFLEGQFNEDFTHPWYFPIGGPQMTSAMALAWYGAKKIGVKSVSIFYLDIGARFLDDKGVFLPDTFRPDNLHPQAKGYDIWGDAVKEKLAELMKQH